MLFICSEVITWDSSVIMPEFFALLTAVKNDSSVRTTGSIPARVHLYTAEAESTYMEQ